MDQPATRERWAGPCGAAERLAVPGKPGNSGGGKGPQLNTDARSNAGVGIDHRSSSPRLVFRSCGGRLFREPDAGNPPVRFDEREEETELRQTGLRRRGESSANRHREATVTAPLLDSTLDFTQNRLIGLIFWM